MRIIDTFRIIVNMQTPLVEVFLIKLYDQIVLREFFIYEEMWKVQVSG